MQCSAAIYRKVCVSSDFWWFKNHWIKFGHRAISAIRILLIFINFHKFLVALICWKWWKSHAFQTILLSIRIKNDFDDVLIIDSEYCTEFPLFNLIISTIIFDSVWLGWFGLDWIRFCIVFSSIRKFVCIEKTARIHWFCLEDSSPLPDRLVLQMIKI